MIAPDVLLGAACVGVLLAFVVVMTLLGKLDGKR